MLFRNKKNTLPHICITSLYCYPLFNPAVHTPFGGTEVRIALIAKELARRGKYRISLIVGDHGLQHIEQREGVTLYTLMGRVIWGVCPTVDPSCPKLGWSRRLMGQVQRQIDVLKLKIPGFSPLAGQIGSYVITPEKIRIYDEVRADVYIMPGNSHFSADMAFYARQHRKKYVFLSGSDYDYYPEFKKYPDRTDMYGTLFALKTYAIESADAHIVQSERQAALLRNGYGRIGKVIKNPIDVNPKFPRNLASQKILWVGKSDERVKRPSIVLELARQLPRFSFVMILNRNIDETHAECIGLAKQLPNVTLIERVPFEEIERYFANARLHLNTSVFEGMPNTFLQAAKYGVPTVSIQVDPGEMLSRHGIGLVSNGDFELFKAHVSEVMTNDNLYKQLSTQALVYVHAYHDKNRIMDQYEQALQEVFGGKNSDER